MDRKTEISDHFMHAGAGTSVALAWVGLIPGVFPFLALTVLVGVVLVLPLVVLGLAAATVAAPSYAAWRFIGWGRRRMSARRGRRRMSARRGRDERRQERTPEPTPVPAPYSGMC
ncbi:MAG: hypothetical protein JOY89_07360 [Solirubrobacterales bacterium]|nr:hypothetical protein [Solirubrobacterales bacterium]